MSSMVTRTVAKTQNWGWGILIVVSALLALNGVALYFISASPATFEQDTGVPISEVRQVFPTVADHIVREGQIISMSLASLGLLAFVVALGGYRNGSPWAWNAMWVLAGTLAAFSAGFILIAGRLDIGAFYLVLATVTLVGQLLARKQPASPASDAG
jgi:hypothetical protein